MDNICTIDAAGNILKRYKNNEDVYPKDGNRYNQKHVRDNMTDAERAGLDVAFVTVGARSDYDDETHKLTPVLAAVGDQPQDSWSAVSLSAEETNAVIDFKLGTSDQGVIRVLDELVTILSEDSSIAAKISQHAKDKIAARKAMRERRS